MAWHTVVLAILVIYIAASIRIVKQYENLVVFTLGKYTGIRPPGLRIVWFIFQTSDRVDLRIRTIDIPTQQMMTEDNVPVSINGVIYFRVTKPEDAVIKVQDYAFAIAQYAETALRDVVGEMDLDAVLSKREDIGNKIRDIVSRETQGWGLVVDHIKLQDVEVPNNLKQIMSRQAGAEREKRAAVIKAEGDKIAASNLAEAAKIMAKNPGSLQLRTLQTIDGLGPSESNTVIIGLPVELMEALDLYLRNKKK